MESSSKHPCLLLAYISAVRAAASRNHNDHFCTRVYNWVCDSLSVLIMADVETNLHVEMVVDILTTIFELFFNNHFVQNFAEKIIKNFA